MKKFISVLLMVCMILTSSVLYAAPVSSSQTTGSISMTLDADKITEVGQIITAKINVKDINNLAGFQINIKYDPSVLQPVKDNGGAYTSSTPISGSTILIDEEYGVFNIGSHKLSQGILNFARSYLSLESYKESGQGESEGTLGVIKFKALKKEATSISFAEAEYMPGMKDGIYLADWESKTIEGYSVIQPQPLAGSTLISIDTDTTKIKEVGQIITASIKAEDFSSIGGYQLNIKYDPAVLQPVKSNGSAYTASTPIEAGDVLADSDYGILAIAVNDLQKGILNQGRCYTNLENYRNSNNPEKSGILGKVRFKVLKVQDTTISFEDTASMPGAIKGTFIFDWNADKIDKYTVNNSVNLEAEGVIIEPKKLEIKSLTADKTGSVEKGTQVTWICEAEGDDVQYAFKLIKDGKAVTETDYGKTNTFSYTLNEAGKYVVQVTVKDAHNQTQTKQSTELEVKEPVIVKEGSVSIDVDTDKIIEAGQIITATINVKDMTTIAGYQVNVKYDPEVLQPVTKSGKAYTNSTNPESGTLLANNEFGPLPISSHNIASGILNFGSAYLYLDAYKESGEIEETGSLAVIRFKVLKVQPTTISFEDTASMPGGNQGTMMFDWNGDRITNYTVKKSVSIDAEEKPVTKPGVISLELDTDKITQEGQIVKATIKLSDFASIAGYQLNLKYDPAVLQPITSSGKAYTNTTAPESGDLIVNSAYTPLPINAHKVEQGILNITRTYLSVEPYKESGEPEQSGIAAVIRFKVLKVQPTTISFEDTESMPNAVNGTYVIDWNANKVTNYTVNKSVSLDAEEIIEPTKLEIKSLTADKTGSVEKGTQVTWICEAEGDDVQYAFKLIKDGKAVTETDYGKTNTFSYTLNEAGKYVVQVTVKDAHNQTQTKQSTELEVKEPVIVKEGSVSIDVDTDKIIEAGQIITATINVKDMTTIAGYQVNVKYDPEVLQPVTKSGKAYTNSTNPESGTLLANNEFGPLPISSHNIASGILNFGSAYLYLDAYKESGEIEETGSLAVIRFKVLKVQPTTISFEDTASMPGGNQGTMMFDWNGDRITNYTVKKSVSIDAEEVPVVVPELKINSLKADKIGSVEKGTTATWTCEAEGDELWYAFKLAKDGNVITQRDYERNNTFSYTLNEAGKYTVEVAVTDAYNNTKTMQSAELEVTEPVVTNQGVVFVELDTDKITEEGQIVKATIKLENFESIAGYQLNLKYDPTVLQPVTASGKAYSNTTAPEAGTLVVDSDYGPFPINAHQVNQGILNITRTYLYLDDYKASGQPEQSGIAAIIRFKVLKVQDTEISFEDTASMPNANLGTYVIDWDANKVMNYVVKKAVQLRVN